MPEPTAEHVQAPKVQGLVLFEVYEANGALLLVTSDASMDEVQKPSPGDVVVRRPWATAAPVEVTRRG